MIEFRRAMNAWAFGTQSFGPIAEEALAAAGRIEPCEAAAAAELAIGVRCDPAAAALISRARLGDFHPDSPFCAARHNMPLALAAFLAQGFEPNRRDNSGRTALHHAAREGAYDCAKLLAERGADPLALCKARRALLDDLLLAGAASRRLFPRFAQTENLLRNAAAVAKDRAEVGACAAKTRAKSKKPGL